MKARTFLAAATLVPGLFLAQSSNTLAVAVVDFDRVVASTPDGKEAITKLKTFGDEQTTAIGKKVKEAEEIESQLRSQERVLSESTRTALARNLDAARTSIETMQQEAQQKFDQMQQQLLGPVEKKAMTAVRTYADERGVKIVFDAGRLGDALLYAHDTADITTEMIRRIAANDQTPGRNLDASERFQQQLPHRKYIDVDFLKAHPSPVTSLVQLARNAN
jgi:Skp family chaperone for outer membrane proteins